MGLDRVGRGDLWESALGVEPPPTVVPLTLVHLVLSLSSGRRTETTRDPRLKGTFGVPFSLVVRVSGPVHLVYEGVTNHGCKLKSFLKVVVRALPILGSSHVRVVDSQSVVVRALPILGPSHVRLVDSTGLSRR